MWWWKLCGRRFPGVGVLLTVVLKVLLGEMDMIGGDGCCCCCCFWRALEWSCGQKIHVD